MQLLNKPSNDLTFVVLKSSELKISNLVQPENI